MLRGEATNTNFVVFGLTRSGLEPTIYRIRDGHVNHYKNDECIVEVDVKNADKHLYYEKLRFKS